EWEGRGEGKGGRGGGGIEGVGPRTASQRDAQGPALLDLGGRAARRGRGGSTARGDAEPGDRQGTGGGQALQHGTPVDLDVGSGRWPAIGRVLDCIHGDLIRLQGQKGRPTRLGSAARLRT